MTRWTACLAAAIVLVTSTASASSLSAHDVSAEGFQVLVSRATHDRSALARLRSVASVKGHSVDVAHMLSGASGRLLDARLRALASQRASSPVDPATARIDASAVLSRPKFRAATPPRPLGGLIDRLGRALAGPVRWVERLLARLSLHVPGESPVLWVIGIGLVLLVALLLGMRSIHRRTRVSNGVAKLHGVGLIDPLELERMATKAESESRFDDAVRLLYVAGIVRLNRAGTIVLTDSLTTHQIETQVGPGPFVELTRTFERVLYGNDEATKMDVAEARAGWTRLLSSDRAA